MKGKFIGPGEVGLYLEYRRYNSIYNRVKHGNSGCYTGTFISFLSASLIPYRTQTLMCF